MGLCNQRAQALGIRREIPAVVAGELALCIGHKGHLVHRQPAGADIGHHLHQVVKGVALDVVLAPRPLLQQGRQLRHISGANVALIGPRVHRDAMGAGLQAQGGSAGHAGNAEVAGVAQGSNLVDVDRQGGGVHRDCRSIIICRVRRVSTPQW